MTKLTSMDVWRGTQAAEDEGARRQGVNVGPNVFQVSPVAYWYHHGHFESEAEARGAFALAYQQGLDGMGESIAAWMGLTESEFNAWVRDGALPERGL